MKATTKYTAQRTVMTLAHTIAKTLDKALSYAKRLGQAIKIAWSNNKKKIYNNGFSKGVTDACVEILEKWYTKSFSKIETIIIETDVRKFYSNETWKKMNLFVRENVSTHSMHMRGFYFQGTEYVYSILINETWESDLNIYTYDDEINGATRVK